ncbi:outer membrane beta-barrel protein [Spirosoma jeollabukense]
MKTILLFLISTTSLLAQGKFSVAPSYWFNYGNYSYKIRSVYDGSVANPSGHSTASSVGLTAHYNFNQKWDLSVGALYNKTISHLKTSINEDTRLTAEYIQFPVLVNYRLSERRLSPYFSAGAIFEKNKTTNSDPLKTNAALGVGIDYKISSRFSWLIQPTASYLLNKPDNTTLFQFDNYTSYRIGIQTQLLIHF